jgi:nitrogen PTS system EIIA component
MRLTVREVAALLGSPEEAVYRWIESGEMPAHRIHDQYRVNRSELLEWATARRLPLAPETFHESNGETLIPSASDCLKLGGVVSDIAGSTPFDVLREIVRHLPLSGADRELLLSLVLARDAAATVTVGGGIAIPHVRKPIVLADDQPLLTLCYLRTCVDFAAADGQPVFALFFLVSPTVRLHLQLLAKLAGLLRNPRFRETLQARAPADRVIDAARRIENEGR